MAIHLVQRAHAYLPCARARAEGDVVVLLGDGVNALLQGAADCFASATDVNERGLTGLLPATTPLLSDAGLVALCAEQSPVVTWTKP